MTRPTSKVIVASAGSGKTTRIVRDVLDLGGRTAVVSFTLNNTEQVRVRLAKKAVAVPSRVTVSPWFTFLLRDLIRPYQNYFVEQRIRGINFVQGRSAPRTRKQTQVYYLDRGYRVYNDKLAELALYLNKLSEGRVVDRLRRLYETVFIDEAQDIAGPDLDLVEMLMDSGVPLCLVGDTRQATYRTNNAMKNSGFWGPNVIKKYQQWQQNGLCELENHNLSYRCSQSICDVADSLFPDHPRTMSHNTTLTGHDGLFVVPTRLVEQYISVYRPQILRFDRRTLCQGHPAHNFGDAKGLEFARVLIFSNGPMKQWLATGDVAKIAAATSKAKVYVAITRAWHSVAFVYDGECAHQTFKLVEPAELSPVA